MEEQLATLEHVNHVKELFLEMFRARDKALYDAREDLNDRLHGMNEFRDTLRDQAGRFIIRDEHTLITNQLNNLHVQVQAQAGLFIGRAEMETLRVAIEKNESKYAESSARMASLETKVYLGGAGIFIVLTVLQLLFNLWHTHGLGIG